MFRQVLNVNYPLGRTYAKGIQVNIVVQEEITPTVIFYKLGAQQICLSENEFQSLVNIESLLTSYFSRGSTVDVGSRTQISATLSVRFDTSFEYRMLVLERLEEKGAAGPGLKTTSIWMIEKSWLSFLSLLPVIKHHLKNRQNWVNNVETLIYQMAKDTLKMYPEEMREGVTPIKYKRFLSSLDIKSYNEIASEGLDITSLFYELSHFCADHILYVARKNLN